MEVKTGPKKLTTLFSTHSAGIRTSLKDLRQAYEGTHGHTPNQAALVKLVQAPDLGTRPGNAPAKTLKSLAIGWQREANQLYTERHLMAIMAARAATAKTDAPVLDIAAAASKIIAAISDKRSTWTAQNVMVGASRWVKNTPLIMGCWMPSA